jgi:lipid-binding SYLF domain-containing protein
MILSGTLALADGDPYAETISMFKNAGQSSAYFSHAYGYAVFPTVGKAGFGVGGAYGKGRVYEKGKLVGDTSISKLSVGLQAGGQAYSEIIFFQDNKAFDNFTSGNFELGADFSAVAITAAASAQANTGGGTSSSASGGKNNATTAANTGYTKGLKVFTITKGGAMAEAAVGGQKFSYKSRG